MQRFVSLDLLRGALLILIAINHSPFWIRKYTEEFVGYVSAAEGFVFVSAFLIGMLFARREQRSGFADASASLLRRSRRIYVAHLLLLASLFLLAWEFAPRLGGIAGLTRPLVEHPFGAGIAGLLLLFQPALLDILPMYVVFSLITPLVFRAATKLGWGTVLSASMGLWICSHFELKQAIFAPERGISFINPGAFDFSAWQLIWVGGLWLGQRKDGIPPAWPRRWLDLIAVVIAGAFLALHWSAAISAGLITKGDWWLLDKWQLGPLRLLNFMALAWLVFRAVPALEQIEPYLRWVSLIGRHMLPVFCTQIAFSILLNGISPWLHEDAPAIGIWLSLQIACALGLALLLEGRERLHLKTASMD